MELQSISKNLFFMVFSFSKKGITRKDVRIEQEGTSPPHTPTGTYFWKIKGSYWKCLIKFAIVEHIWFKKGEMVCEVVKIQLIYACANGRNDVLFMSRSQKKQYKRMESLNKFQRVWSDYHRWFVWTVGMKNDTERKTVVLDGWRIPSHLNWQSHKTVLPVSEGDSWQQLKALGDSDSIIDGE